MITLSDVCDGGRIAPGLRHVLTWFGVIAILVET